MLVLDKRALSNLVAYVLLISITISLSVVVYGWLKFYVNEEDVAECPEGVNLIISSYDCVAGSDGYLEIDLRNKGLFSVDGFVLNAHNRTGAEFGLYTLYSGPQEILPGGSYRFRYDFSGTGFDRITLVDISPYLEDINVSHCESYVAQEIDCD
jgi:hypothetical protein